MFQIDPMSREPVYEQIIQQVQQFILTDVLQPGGQIPSVRSVSMTNSINPRTILKAYTELDAKGLIQSVPGKGYYVCADAKQKLLEKGREKMKDLTEMLTALAMALAQPMAHLFVGYDAGLFALTVHAFRLFAWSFLLAGFNIFTSGFFTALNNGAVSAAISFLRTLVFQSASVLILPVFFGVDGIWWAITVAEVFAFLISGMFLLLKRNKYHYM